MRTPLLERHPVTPAPAVEPTRSWSTRGSVRGTRPLPARLTTAVVLVAMVSAQLAWVTPARADDTAKAKAMFTEGLGLEQANDFAGALSKFEAVAKVKKTPQVMFHVAYCQERVGRMVEALALYNETLAEAAAGASDPKLAQVKTTTAAAIAALEKKIPTVTVTSKGPKPAGAEITLDGKKLAALDKPEKVDPGVHTVEAKADGKEPFSAKVDAPEETQRTVEIRWKDSKKASDAEAEEPEPAPVAPPPPAPSSKLPFVVGGIGVASLIASGVFFGIRSSAQSELEDKCQGTLCPESVRAAGDRGKTATTISNVTLVVGIVGLGAGITLYALDSKKAPAAASLVPTPTRLRAGVSALPGAGFASVSGAFLASLSVPVAADGLLSRVPPAVPLPEVPPMPFRRAAALLPVLFVACSFPDYQFDDARFNAQSGDAGEGGSDAVGGTAGSSGKGGKGGSAANAGAAGSAGDAGGSAGSGEGGTAGEGGSGAGAGGTSSGAGGGGGTDAGGAAGMGGSAGTDGGAGTGGTAGASSGAGGTSAGSAGVGGTGSAGKGGAPPAGTCKSASDCKANESCSEPTTIGSDQYFKCFVKNPDAGAFKPGGLCDDGGDCDSFVCLTTSDATKGVCSGTCGTTADCAPTSVCFENRFSQNSSVRLCAPSCLSDAGCDAGLKMNCALFEDEVSSTLAFACQPTGGAGFGEEPPAGGSCKSGVSASKICTKPCESNAECGPPFPACKSAPVGTASGGTAVIKVCSSQ